MLILFLILTSFLHGTYKEDVRIPAQHPLKFTRATIDGKWHFLPHHELILKGPQAFTSEPKGTPVRYALQSQNLFLSETIDHQLEQLSPRHLRLTTSSGDVRNYEWVCKKGPSIHFRLISETVNGTQISYFYDEFFRLARAETADSFFEINYLSKPAHGSDFDLSTSDGRLFHYHFNHLNLASVEGPGYLDLLDAEPAKPFPLKTNAEYTYDIWGEVASETIGQEKTLFSYDLYGRLTRMQREELVTLIDYDLFGRPIEKREETIKGTLLTKETYAYAADGKQTRFVWADKGPVQKEPPAIRPRILERQCGPFTVTIDYDLCGRKEKLTLPDGSWIYYQYIDGRLVEILRFSTKGKLLYKHTFLDYDLCGLPKRQRLIEGLGEITFELDEEMNIVRSTTPYACFVPTPRIEVEITPLEEPKEIIYDKFGKPLKLYFLYDEEGEIGTIDETGKIQELKVRAPIWANSGDNSIVFEVRGRSYVPIFDLAGNVSQLISILRRAPIEFYTYDEKGEVTIRDDWGDIVSTSPSANPWNLHGQRN